MCKVFFYIDEREFYGIYNQIFDNVKDIQFRYILDANITGGIQTNTSIVNKLLPQFSAESTVAGTKDSLIITQKSIEEKIIEIIEYFGNVKELKEVYLTEEQKSSICAVCGNFALTKIITNEGYMENFDCFDRLDYHLSRLKEDVILIFEANSLIIQNPDSQYPPVIMKMSKDKMIKRIHHYSSKIAEYESFSFNVLGEIEKNLKGISINPIVVWG